MAGHTPSRFTLRLQGVLAVLLFAAVVGLLGYLAHSYDRRFDWTANGRNSLSQASRQVLDKLPEPVSVTAFVRPNPQLRADINDLLQRYAAASPRFTVSYVNPDQAPARVKELGIRADGTVVLELAGRREKLEQLDEQALTSALMRLSRSGERKLIFLTGHGERSPDGQANHDLSSFTAALREQGVQATRPDPASGRDFPTDATLVITAPAVDLTADEVAAVQRFLAAGGNLLWLADPGPLHGLEPVAAELGLQIGRRRDMIGMRMSLDQPSNFQIIRSDIFDNSIGRAVRSPARGRFEVEHRVDDRRFCSLGVMHDVGYGVGGFVEEAGDRRTARLIGAGAPDLLRGVGEWLVGSHRTYSCKLHKLCICIALLMSSGRKAR